VLHVLKRHPFPVRAHFEFSLVLTYALPAPCLQPLLPPGLMLDTYEDWGFVAIAMVQTSRLHPVFVPEFCGQSFFLTGYRIFARFRDPRSGRTLRGLRILRSDTDNSAMAFFGNRLTHYNYQRASVERHRTGDALAIRIATPGHAADLHVSADVASVPAPLPPDSVFPTLKIARRYAGPLPFTFDYEAKTHSIIKIEGVRTKWNPQPIQVRVHDASFFARAPFDQMPPPRLSNAFWLEGVPYMWKRGERARLERN